MCLTGAKPTNPGSYEEYRVREATAGGDPSRRGYDAAVKRWQNSDEFKEQQKSKAAESEIDVAEKTEAQKTAEAKEKAMEEKIATVTAPVSTMEPKAPAKRRQEETKLSIEPPKSESTAVSTEPLVEEPAAAEMVADTPEGSLIKKRKQKQMDLISGLSKKRSRARGRRSLITGKSGGGIGYYSRFFT
jgi:preprotein translocase subunit SecD